MSYQSSIDFVQTRQNSRENEAILEMNLPKIKTQCDTIYQAMLRGEKLTTTSALLRYGIGDLRARIRDLVKSGIPIKKEIQKGGYKIYSI